MIVSLKKYREFGWAKAAGLLAKSALLHFKPGRSKSRRLRSFLTNGLEAPKLRTNEQGHSMCVSCGLCVEVCPANSIKLETEKSISFPKGLLSGPAPKTFEISEDTCVRCSLCAEICPVKALVPCQ